MRAIRMMLAGLVGFPLLAIGLILIPLPGPGLLICFIALFVLSLGFKWAGKYLDKCKVIFRSIYVRAKARADRIEEHADK